MLANSWFHPHPPPPLTPPLPVVPVCSLLAYAPGCLRLQVCMQCSSIRLSEAKLPLVICCQQERMPRTLLLLHGMSAAHSLCMVGNCHLCVVQPFMFQTTAVHHTCLYQPVSAVCISAYCRLCTDSQHASHCSLTVAVCSSKRRMRMRKNRRFWLCLPLGMTCPRRAKWKLRCMLPLPVQS